MTNYTVILLENDKQTGKYNLNEELYNLVKNTIKPYKLLQSRQKAIRCIETGQIFENARAAANWVTFVKENYYCDMHLIKQCCRGKQKTSYGYHWEFFYDKPTLTSELLKE